MTPPDRMGELLQSLWGNARLGSDGSAAAGVRGHRAGTDAPPILPEEVAEVPTGRLTATTEGGTTPQSAA